MIDEASPWVGRATPQQSGDLALAYWATDASLADLIAKHKPESFPSKLYRIAGPATLDCKCDQCGAAFVATSRSGAVQVIGAEIDARRRRRPHLCRPCGDQARVDKMRENWAHYLGRAARAEELRWMPYREYLGTDDWSERRKRVIRRAGFRCQVCASEGKLHVHHRTYARRGNEREEDMIALCPDCHELFHKNGRLAENGRAA